MRNINSLYRLIKPTLVHKVQYSEYKSQDRNHKPTYKDAETIDHVRVDITETYNQTSNSETTTISAVLFMYRTLTTPFKRLLEKSIIVHGGKKYIIHKVVDCTEPYNDNIFSYEVELIES